VRQRAVAGVMSLLCWLVTSPLHAQEAGPDEPATSVEEAAGGEVAPPRAPGPAKRGCDGTRGPVPGRGRDGLVVHESGHLALDAAFGAGWTCTGSTTARSRSSPSRPATGSPAQRFAVGSAGSGCSTRAASGSSPATPACVMSARRSPRACSPSTSSPRSLRRDGPGHGGPVGSATPAAWPSRCGGRALGGPHGAHPAALDAWRYVHPEATWVRWASRAAKVALVVLLVRPHGAPATR